MPYIEQAMREFLEKHGISPGSTPGELAYVLYKTCLDYLPEDPRYYNLNEVMGALECARQEFYRQQVAPYEDTKIEANGDIER